MARRCERCEADGPCDSAGTCPEIPLWGLPVSLISDRWRHSRSTRAALVLSLLLSVVMLLQGCGGPVVRAPVGKPLSRGASTPKATGAAVYTVRKGDTLYGIAWANGVDFRTIASINGISAPYTIYPGQRLQLTDGRRRATRSTRSATVRSNDQRVARTTGGASGSQPRAVTQARDTRRDTRSQQGSSDGGRSGATAGSVSTRAAPEGRTPSTERYPARISRWHWPSSGRLVRGFGTSGNKGIDIAGHEGQKIYAAAAGRVVYSGSGLRGYGNLIIIKHNERFLSAYGHNRANHVQEGQTVAAGEHIADMGMSGTKDIKLHFEIRRDGKPVDPIRYLPGRGG